MPNNEYIGAGVSLPEIVSISIPAVVAGVRYGLEAYNIAPVSTWGIDGDTAGDILGRLAEQLNARGVTMVGAAVTADSGRATGLRVDSAAGSYIEVLNAGRAPTPKQVRLRMPLGTSGGTFTLTSTVPGGSGETTSGISGVAAASAIDTALEGLTTPQSGDISCALEVVGNSTTRRSYLITLGGTLAGKDVELTANGASLVGSARVNISTVQRAGDASREVQVIWLPKWDDSAGTLWIRLKSSTRSGDWLYGINFVDTSGTAPGTGQSWAVMIQRLVDDACGAGIWTATWHYDPDHGGVIVLVATDATARDQVTGVIRYNISTGTQPTSVLQPSGLYTLGDNSDTPAYTYGYSCTSETIRGSGTSQNEIVMVKTPALDLGGSYDYAFDGNTATIVSNANESFLQTGWDTLAGSGNSEVFANSIGSGTGAYPYFVMLKGTRANSNQPAVTIEDSGDPLPDAVQVIQQGTALLNQIDQIVIEADSGTFTLTYAGGSATSNLAFDLNAAALETALEGRTEVGAGNCTVTGSGTPADPFRAEYVSGKAATVMPALTANTSNLVGGPDPEIATVTAAVPGQYAQANLRIDPNANGGFLRVIGSGTSGEIQWDDDAAAVQTALDAHTGLAALGVTVTGEFPLFLMDFDTWGVMPTLSISQDSLTVTESSLLVLSRIQEPAGPNCWDDPNNWSLRHIPSTGETVILRDGSVSIDEGLLQRWSWERSGSGLRLFSDIAGARCNLRVGQCVRLNKGAGDTFPTLSSGSLSDATSYYIVSLDRWTGLCEISTTSGGTPLTLTGDGTGDFTIEVLLAGLVIHSTQGGSDGAIGLPRLENGQRNERPLFLRIAATSSDLGVGVGNGANRLNIDYGDRQATVRQDRSGSSPVVGEMATNLRFDNTSSSVELLGGSLAVNPWDDADTAGSCGAVVNRNGQLLLGAVDIGSLDSLGGSVQSGDQVGFTCRGAQLIRP